MPPRIMNVQDVSGERWIATRTLHEHVDYDPDTTDMDFAILELEEELTFTDKIRPACIPENDSDDYVGVDGESIRGRAAVHEKGFLFLLYNSVVSTD